MTDLQYSFPAMGSAVEIVALGARPGSMQRCQQFVGDLERSWSRFLPNSELERLNATAGSGPQRCSPLLCDAVDASLALWRATDGLFDPTTRDALEWCGYDRDFARVRERSELSARCSPRPVVPTPQGVVVDHEQGLISLPRGVRLDLGGVGKGLAADLVAALLVEQGALAACVSVGGDIATAGQHPDGGWLIPVLDPSHADRVGWELLLGQGAVVQSNRVVRSWGPAGEHHHLIDPRTGLPARSGVLGVVVRDERAWWAEGVAKAALVAGPVDGAKLLQRLVRAAWIIHDTGAVTPVGDIAVERAA